MEHVKDQSQLAEPVEPATQLEMARSIIIKMISCAQSITELTTIIQLITRVGLDDESFSVSLMLAEEALAGTKPEKRATRKYTRKKAVRAIIDETPVGA